MGKKYFQKWYRRPRTRNEAKQNQEGWCRAKRRPNNLPDSWNDYHSCVQNTWKVKRKTKYRPGKRGKKHTIFCDGYIKAFDLKEYCETHDIPCDVERVTEPYTYWRDVWKKEVVGRKPVYHYTWRRMLNQEDGKIYKVPQKCIWFYVNEYDTKYAGKEEVRTSRTIGYNFTWWSNKDIGIEYILNRQHRY